MLVMGVAAMVNPTALWAALAGPFSLAVPSAIALNTSPAAMALYGSTCLAYGTMQMYDAFASSHAAGALLCEEATLSLVLAGVGVLHAEPWCFYFAALPAGFALWAAYELSSRSGRKIKAKL
jgi:hypothetical protein